MKTAASNPGSITIHWPTYAKYRLVWFVAYLVFFLIGLALLVLFRFNSNGIAAFVAIVGSGVYWVVTCGKHWKHGDANPGVVISTEPLMVAVLAEMSQYPNDFSAPAIKIIAAPAPPEETRVGDRFATVALYAGGGNENTWRDIDPKLTYTATNNPLAIRRVFDSIPDWQWQALNDAVKQVGNPEKFKVYPVEVDFEQYINPPDSSEDESLQVPGFVEEKDMQVPGFVEEESEEVYTPQTNDVDRRIRFVCSSCLKQYEVPSKYVGRTVRCKKCDTHNMIPNEA